MAITNALPAQYTYSADEAVLCGPIDVGGTLYAVVIDTTNGDTRVVRSNDQFSTIAGATSLGATNTGTVTAMCYGELYGTDEFYTLRVDANDAIIIDVYNTTSDSVTTTSAVGPSLSFSGGTFGDEVALCIRSNGDVIVIFGGVEKIMGTEYSRVNYSTWDRSANSWSASVSVSPTGVEFNYNLGGCEVDSGDRAHIFYSDQSGNTLVHRALSSGNSLGTANTAVSNANIAKNSCGQPHVYTDGTEKVGVSVLNTSNQLVFANGDVANSISTWITITQSTYTLSVVPPQTWFDNGNTYFFWVQSSDNELHYSVYDGSTWNTPTAITSVTTTDAVSIHRNGLVFGVLYQSASDLYYYQKTNVYDEVGDQSYDQIVLSDDPHHYWRLNEASGDAINLGSVGSTTDGTYNSVTRQVTGLIRSNSDTAAGFDGASSYIALPDNAELNTSDVTAHTVELWFNANDVTTRQVLYEQGAESNGVNIYLDAGSLYFAVWSTAYSWTIVWVSAPVSINTTYQAVFVYDGNNTTLEGFLNGSSVGTATPGSTLSGHNGDCGIGAANEGTSATVTNFHDGAPTETTPSYFFNGTIDEVSVYWNTALTSSTIAFHYDSAVSVFAADGTAFVEKTTDTNNTYNEVASSGILAGGIADEFSTYSETSSSGILAGGIAGVEKISGSNTYNEVATGGIFVNGISDELSTYTKTATGGSVVNGTTSVGRLIDKTTFGGIVANGTALVAKIGNIYNEVASGGILAGGIADELSIYTKTASGGILAGGISDKLSIYTKPATGGSVVAGNAFVKKGGTIEETATGGVVVGGIATHEIANSLYAQIDEVSADDGDYIYASPTGTICKVALGTIEDPGVNYDHVIQCRFHVPADGLTLTIDLIENTTTITSQSYSPSTAGWHDILYELSPAEADAITDYSNLSVKLTAT